MIDYSRSKLYIIKDVSNDNIIHIGATVSNLKRRYWNHKMRQDRLFKRVEEQNLDWRRLRIHTLKEYPSCQKRSDLRCTCSLLKELFDDNNYDLIQYVLENLDHI